MWPFLNNVITSCECIACTPATSICYTGVNLTCIGVNKNDSLSVALEKIDALMCVPITNSEIITALGYTPVNPILNINTTSPLLGGGNLTTDRTLSIQQSTGIQNGYLSSTDWNTFNNKQPAGNYITSLTGEVIASGAGAAVATLSTPAVTGKILTGLNITGGSISATDSILSAFGKAQNQINGVLGGSIFQTTWNASTNTPILTSSIGTKGYYYIVDVAGSTNLDGIIDWKIGDWAIYDGTVWRKVDNTDAVSSVNGFTGAVSLTTSNITEGTNLYYTEGRVSANIDVSANTAVRHNAVTLDTTNGLSLSGQQISLGLSSTSTIGALSSTDWNVFNNKQNALGYTPENVANKSDSYTASSSTTYASTKAIVDGLATKQNTLTNPITGTGTTNTISKFTASGTVGNSSIFDNGRVMINTVVDDGVNNLQVNGSIRSSGSLRVGASPFGFGFFSVNNTMTIDNEIALEKSGAGLLWGRGNFTHQIFYANSLQRLIVNMNGISSTALTLSTAPTTSAGTYDILTRNTSTGVVEKVLSSSVVGGSGTTNYVPKFTASGVIGNSLITDNGSLVSVNSLSEFKGTTASDGGQLGSELTTTATGTNWTGTGFATGYTHTTGDVTPLVSTLAAVTNNLYQITYTVTGRTTGSITINFGGIAITGITSSGNSGPKAISTATLNIVPTTDFNGTIVLSIKTISPSVATTVFKNSSGAVTNEIRAHYNNTNVSIGLNAMQANTTGIANSAVGRSALQNNTTGNYNSAIGPSALQNNTTGNYNSAIGLSALANNTTGNYNSAVGASALLNNTTGGSNSAIGYLALLNNTTGGNNNATGDSAGRYIADKSTPATILNNSTMLGYRTSPLADNQTNQVVIGYDATGLGSNTTVIGNSSTTTARVYGRQLVNTSTDNGTDQLQVNGTISATGGTTANQVVVKSQLDAQKPYKVYTALLSQSGTSAPTATVLENTLGGTVFWSREAAGFYNATLAGVFTLNKTTVLITQGNGQAIYSGYGDASTNYVNLLGSSFSGMQIDNLLDRTTVEIRVYN